MPGRRLPLALLAPISLVVLVVALGALQYRWVGQVSEGERDQLRQSLDRRAREFADDFDREIGRAYQLFRTDPGLTLATPERFAKQYDEWQSVARFAGLVKAAFLATPNGNDFSLARYEPGRRIFEPVEWPASLQPVRSRLVNLAAHKVPPLGNGQTVITIAAPPVLPDVPALLISDSSPAGLAQVVLEFDKDVIASTVLPALAAVHFPETGADRFRLAVTNAKAEAVLSRGLLAGQILDPGTADAVAGFFGLRFEMFRGTMTEKLSSTLAAGTAAVWSSVSAPAVSDTVVVARPHDGDPKTMSMVIEQRTTSVSGRASGTAVRMPAGAAWRLLIQHGAGSVDAAVARARRRNLWLSFGILSVLALSAGLVMNNARRSEKLAAQQMDFVATVSHELRTPLAVIRSAAQNLSAGVIHEPDQAKRYGELIESEGRRLTDMVEQVLEYAGLSGNRRPPASRLVDAAALAHDVVSSAASLPEADGVIFDAQIDDRAPAVMADEDAIRRALHNLIGNALKYGADGRWIGVSVARGSGGEEHQVKIAVADRGRGIPPAELPHIFEPFYRGRFAQDRQIHGNGLGLSLVKRIVEAHGGRVSVQSTPDQGATFTMHLPVAAGAVAATPASAARAPLDQRPAGEHSG